MYLMLVIHTRAPKCGDFFHGENGLRGLQCDYARRCSSTSYVSNSKCCMRICIEEIGSSSSRSGFGSSFLLTPSNIQEQQIKVLLNASPYLGIYMMLLADSSRI